MTNLLRVLASRICKDATVTGRGGGGGRGHAGSFFGILHQSLGL